MFLSREGSGKQAVITGTSVGGVAELHFLKPKLEGRRHKRLGCFSKVTSFFNSCLVFRRYELHLQGHLKMNPLIEKADNQDHMKRRCKRNLESF